MVSNYLYLYGYFYKIYTMNIYLEHLLKKNRILNLTFSSYLVVLATIRKEQLSKGKSKFNNICVKLWKLLMYSCEFAKLIYSYF